MTREHKSFERILKNLLLTIVSIVLTLILVEIMTRIIIPQGAFLIRPCIDPHRELGTIGKSNCDYFDDWGEEVHSYNYNVHHNNIGARMRDDVDSTSNLERVFVMGDSFTYGWGVELNQSYFGLINQSINSLFENIQLINMGFGGYSTGHHRKQFSLFQQQIEPKFAILFLNFTDLEDNVRQNHNYRVYDISSGIDGKIKTIPRKVYSTLKSFLLFYTPYNWLTKNSHFLVASIRLFKDIKNPKARERDDNKILGYASIPEGLTDEEIRLMSLVSLEHLEQMFIEYEKTVEKALIIWAPHRCELELIDSKPCSFPFSDFTKQVELLSRKYQNVFWLNPLNEMIVFTKGKNSEYIYFNEGHFNIKGNQLYAESIGNEVVNFFNNANP